MVVHHNLSGLAKRWLFLPILFIAGSVFSQTGYEIKVTLKPFANQYVYLGHYSGKQYPFIDSVRLDANSQGIFRGSKPLGGGIYIIIYPQKNGFIEMLVDKQQHFSIEADTSHVDGKRKFTNSADNDLFLEYQQQMAVKGRQMESVRTNLKNATNAKDSAKWNDELKKVSAAISAYRKKVAADHPNTLMSLLMHLMEEPVVPPAEKHPGGKYDSTYAYRYYKDNYWNGIGFWDDRVTRTPAALFEDRLDKYFNTLVYPAADSVIKEIDYMLGYASASKEMTRVLLVKFVNRYLNMKYMWEDAVFVHLFEKYFSQKEYDWLTPEGKKIITNRAYNLMANIMGRPAENIMLPDSTGATKSLYADTARFTVVCFYDPTCGHCKETLPLLDSLYRLSWKKNGVSIYAVAKETDATRKDWLRFVKDHHLEGWTHVFYSKAEEKARIDANIPSYSQLYDVQTFPTIYLLDRDKRVVAKKLSWQQTDEILQLKLKQP